MDNNKPEKKVPAPGSSGLSAQDISALDKSSAGIASLVQQGRSAARSNYAPNPSANQAPNQFAPQANNYAHQQPPASPAPSSEEEMMEILAEQAQAAANEPANAVGQGNNQNNSNNRQNRKSKQAYVEPPRPLFKHAISEEEFKQSYERKDYLNDLTITKADFIARNKPWIERSTGEEAARRRAVIESKLDGYLKPSEISDFEVDFWTQFPDMLPNRATFPRNGIQYCRRLIGFNFDFAFFDTETTGFNTDPNIGDLTASHRIISMGIAFLDGGKLVAEEDSFHEIFNPHCKIQYESGKVHGITDAVVATKPDFKQFIPQIRRLLEGKVIMAHNADFDITFINNELKIAGENWRLQDIALVVDTIDLSKSLNRNAKHSLDALSERYEINDERIFHGALLDSIILGKVFIAMIENYQESIFVENYDLEFAYPIAIELYTGHLDVAGDKAKASQIKVQVSEEDLQIQKDLFEAKIKAFFSANYEEKLRLEKEAKEAKEAANQEQASSETSASAEAMVMYNGELVPASKVPQDLLAAKQAEEQAETEQDSEEDYYEEFSDDLSGEQSEQEKFLQSSL